MSSKKKENKGVQGLLFAIANVEKRPLAKKMSKNKPGPDRLPSAKVERPEPQPARIADHEHEEKRAEGLLFDGMESDILHPMTEKERELSDIYGVPLSVIQDPRRSCQKLSEVDITRED